MPLTKSQIASIKELAGKLTKWFDEQPYSPPSKTLIRLSPSALYKDEILILLHAMPGLGQKVDNEFHELDEQVRDYESWRGKEITEKNEDDFDMAVQNLKGALYGLAETLTRVADLAQDTADDIPGEHRTSPMSKQELARLWGPEMTAKKITAMIKAGNLKAIKQSRQTFIFDTNDLPQRVRDRLDKGNQA